MKPFFLLVFPVIYSVRNKLCRHIVIKVILISIGEIRMQNSYSFLVNLETPGFHARFKIGDGTQWEVSEYWTFLENSRCDIVDNLGHIVVIKQINHRDRAYSKKFEVYPLEQTEFSTIERNLSDPCYWFSTTYREYEYDQAFRPSGKGSFHKILCKLTFERLFQIADAQQDASFARGRISSFKKRYNYSSLQNISSTAVKSITITMQTVISYLLKAIEDDNDERKDQAIEFIVENFRELKSTDLWKEFSTNHRELKEKHLDVIIEHMGNQTERANSTLQKTISRWNIAD